MIHHWKKNKNKNELNIMLENRQRGKFFALTCIILAYSTVHGRFFQWIIENLNNWKNPEYYKNYTLFVEAYFPFKWNYTPIFELTCFIEYFAIICSTLSNCGTDCFFSQITFHFVGQYQILRLKFTDLIKNNENNTSKSEFNKKFKHIICIHNHIIRLFFITYL